MGGGDAPTSKPTHEHVHEDVSDLFFNADHSDIKTDRPPTVETTDHDHLGYQIEGLKRKAAEFIGSLERIGAQFVPTVEGLIKDFHKRH